MMLILGAVVLAAAAVYFFATRPAAAPGAVLRPWYERGLDAITPDEAALGFEGFGVSLKF